MKTHVYFILMPDHRKVPRRDWESMLISNVRLEKCNWGHAQASHLNAILKLSIEVIFQNLTSTY